MIILDLDDKSGRPLSRSISHDSLLSLRQSKIHRLSSLVPPDYHTSQLQAQAQAQAQAQVQVPGRQKPFRKRFWPLSRRLKKIVLYVLAVYFVLTAAIAVPVLIVKLRENNSYLNKSNGDSASLSGLTPLATTLPNDAQYSQYYTSSVNGAPLVCTTYNIGTNSTLYGAAGPNSTVLGVQNATVSPSGSNDTTYSSVNATYSSANATSANYTTSLNGNFSAAIPSTGTITAQFTTSTNGTIYIRSNATNALPNIYGSLNVTVSPNSLDINSTQPLISLSMAYNQSGAQNIVSLCTITTADEWALGIYIPEQLADTDFLNFSINVTLPNLTHYSELSTYLPSFNQVFNLTQYVTMDKLLVQGPMSNVSLVSVAASTVILKAPTEELFNGQFQYTNTTPLVQQ